MNNDKDFKECGQLVSSFRIVACTYEGLLYGIDTMLFLKEDMNVNTCFNLVWMFESNSGCIHSVAVGGRLYDLKKKKDLGSLYHQSGTITDLAFSSKVSPKFLVSVSQDGTMVIFRTRDWLPFATIKTYHGSVNSISIHPSGKAALTVGSDKNIRLWNMMTGEKAGKYSLNNGDPFCIQWNILGDRYAVLFNKEVAVYDMSATLVYCFSSPTQLNSIHYTMSGKSHREMLVLGSQDGCIQICDSSNGKLLKSFFAHENRVKAITSYTFQTVDASFSLILITASSNGSIKLWLEFQEFSFLEIGEYNCGESRITCMSIVDSFIEVEGFGGLVGHGASLTRWKSGVRVSLESFLMSREK
ncbi:hypothetical protein PORY_000077 [Pneumocystis oryctolagi]|uniref:Uncharacterized protein n=1 Tax=Pneumocystis oryctolagi TaxID=42067 RepID=A0ACB7CGG7_9ASCO|nr:hypothetical protein PORY_000077 [Pneumocystis oryctolagi]